ncbi:MAG: hypothetical protein QM723_00370 [Myxococcaceae bacterium]
MKFPRWLLALAVLASMSLAGCDCGGAGCPAKGVRVRYRFDDACASGVIVATAIQCKPLDSSYDKAAGDPSYTWRYQVLDAGGIPPPPDFDGYVLAADGGPWPLSDGGLAPDGGFAHYRECSAAPELDRKMGFLQCYSWGAKPVAAVNVQLDTCQAEGMEESREDVPYQQ